MTARSTGPGPKPLFAAFTRYHRDLHRYLVRRLKDEREAEDLAQEVYLRLLRVEDSEMVRSPQDYLYGIAAHVVYQFRIRTVRDVVTYDSEIVEEAASRPAEWTTDALPDQLSVRQEIERVLSGLPATHRAIFLLRKRDGLSVKEIAAELQLSAHTVKKYLFQAQAQIRTQWTSGDRAHE